MSRGIQIGLALYLAGVMAAPASAQIAIQPAAKGESVVVTLCDGREIVGEVGKWLDHLGFYVKPQDSAAYLIHPDDVVGIRAAKTDAARSLPVYERRGMSANTAAAIAVFATIGFVLLLKSALPSG
jgi:hypothetical protein